jgi:hypothetical protein
MFSSASDLLSGYIPAPTGELSAALKTLSQMKVHLHVCRVAFKNVLRFLAALGISPRMRGKPVRKISGSCPHRNIPVRTGESPLYGIGK